MHWATLFPAFESLGMWGYWVVFVVAYLEAVAIVGSFVPGGTFMIFAGFLSAHGYLDLGDLFWFGSAGAILGDATSYALGTKGTHWFRDEARFLKLAHLDRGRQFLERHGGKSIFFGRFVGPVRSIIPFVAGLTRMERRRFLWWDILGGTAWAVAHLLVGRFAANALRTFQIVETWSSRIGIVFLVLLAGLVVFQLFRSRQ